MMPMKILIEW